VVRNNAGGDVNHTMFWEIMAPNAGGAPSGALAQAISSTFGSFDNFKTQLVAAGIGRFGSGWAWLSMNADGSLRIESTANQDNPLMEGRYPVMGVDVWEHAYYLKYYNQRVDYLNAWWNVANWPAIQQRYDQARQGRR
jgi:Fe-Mn family superoxide dismutase